MAGKGTGYPNWFICPAERRQRNYNRVVGWAMPDHHSQVRTGRTKPAPSPTKGHARKLRESHEYRCDCGLTGWTCHYDILGAPLEDA